MTISTLTLLRTFTWGIVTMLAGIFLYQYLAIPNLPEDSRQEIDREAYQPSVPITPFPDQVSFVAVGDIQLSRSVALKTNQNPDLAFSGTKDLLSSADFAMGNLESPFSSSDQYIFKNTFSFNAPKKYAPLLYKYNFRYLALANNHGFDQGLDGVVKTQEVLDALPIQHSGSGANKDEAWAGAIVKYNNFKIGILSASYGISNGGSETGDYFALMSDSRELASSIALLKGSTDFVIVQMHSGEEYTRTPNSYQTTFARLAVDNGADMVIGHHPHWIQTIEKYKNKYIFYSLGNFIFDQNWSRDTSEGLAIRVELERKQKYTSATKIELLPVVIENNCCPRPATTEEGKSILKKIAQENFVLLSR